MGALTLDDDAKIAFAHLQKLIFANNSGCMPALSGSSAASNQPMSCVHAPRE